MRFTIRSFGGKLIALTSLTFLLCILLLILASWLLLTFYSMRITQSSASQHLLLLKRKYQETSTLLIQEAKTIASDARITTIVTQNIIQPDNSVGTLAPVLLQHRHFSSLTIVSNHLQILAQIDSNTSPSETLSSVDQELTTQALQGYSAIFLRPENSSNAITPPITHWEIQIAVPITMNNTITGILLVSQAIDTTFAQILSNTINQNILLCLNGHILASTTLQDFFDSTTPSAQQTFCQTGSSHTIHAAQTYLAQASTLPANNQLMRSPSLTLVDIELVTYPLSSSHQLFLLLAGMGLFICGFCIVLYALLTQKLFIQPLRRIEAQMRTLIGNSEETKTTPLVPSSSDELSMLARSFNLLSASLEQENLSMVEQMSNILVLSDALISTLNLEHLLGEIVSRLGHIMQEKHVSLLLYGREMPAPWAVAQWSDTPSETPGIPATPGSFSSSGPHGAVTVHADPSGDITMAATTKMTVIPSSHLPSPSGKRQSVQPTKPTDSSAQETFRTRIPRPALRDLDMILARMVIQRKKIAYGEDIETIYRERGETWARIAYHAGYHSVIAVPLLLQDQAIGAFILYSDHPNKISSRDTFLLSTAAIQSSMAIQNALLFAEIKDKNAALERANQLKSQFLANVTHELRTPLHSIISYGSFILDGFLDGTLTQEQEEHIQFMVHSAEDLAHLVNDMLDLSKIEADRIEIKPEPMELLQALKEMVSQLKPLADSKHLMISLEMEENLPSILADSHRLRQVLVNLVSNAIKFTEQGGVTISATLIRRDDTVRIAVRDTGIGISPAALGYIFEAFRQADGSTTRRFGGTGLGLTIARKLIELQGGEVAVESTVGQGSIFSFTLPTAPPLVTHTPQAQQMHQAP